MIPRDERQSLDANGSQQMSIISSYHSLANLTLTISVVFSFSIPPKIPSNNFPNVLLPKTTLPV